MSWPASVGPSFSLGPPAPAAFVSPMQTTRMKPYNDHSLHNNSALVWMMVEHFLCLWSGTRVFIASTIKLYTVTCSRYNAHAAQLHIKTAQFTLSNHVHFTPNFILNSKKWLIYLIYFIFLKMIKSIWFILFSPLATWSSKQAFFFINLVTTLFFLFNTKLPVHQFRLCKNTTIWPNKKFLHSALHAALY